MEDNIKKIVSELEPLYLDTDGDVPETVLSYYPNPHRVVQGLKTLIDVILPGRVSFEQAKKDSLDSFLTTRIQEASSLFTPEIATALALLDKGKAVDQKEKASKCFENFVSSLPAIRKSVVEDIKAAYNGDPAALSYAEIKLTYPGLIAVVSHRIAHEFYKLQIPIVPRIMNEWTHSKTGIDIHPGASIGDGFFIDHGTGVVIGETSSIGKNVKIYQGVTLGAKSFPLDENGRAIKNIKRHPNVEDDVVIYANAAILGGDTVIGKGSTIGGGVFLMESVAPGSFVANPKPELFIKKQD